MLAHLVRRVIGTIPVVVMISLLVFLLIHAAPGDPADLLLSDDASPQEIADARHRWGLDQPVYIQYLRFLLNVLRGDLGISFRYSDPVLGLIWERMPATIELAVVSFWWRSSSASRSACGPGRGPIPGRTISARSWASSAFRCRASGSASC